MDQLIAMRTFVRVVQTGNFSSAGREQDTSQATISKRVAGLESMLGVKLLTRTSRELALTEVGAEYYDKCLAILAELDEADAGVRSQIASPKGVLKIAVPIAFARLVLAPILLEFTQKYPEIILDLATSDKHIDLIEEGIDLAIRAKKLEDSNLVARHLFDNPMIFAASPNYLNKHGVPNSPEELKHHNCIIYANIATANVWRLTRDDEEYAINVTGNTRSNSGDTNLEAALAGVGIVALPIWMLEEDIRSGRLIRLLSDYQGSSIPINIIYPQNRYVPLKVRCFVDFIKQKIEANSIFR